MNPGRSLFPPLVRLRTFAVAAVMAIPASRAAEIPGLSEDTALAECLATGDFGALQGMLEKDAETIVGSLEAGAELDLADPATRLRLLLWAVLERFPVADMAGDSGYVPEFLRWLFTQPGKLETLLAEIRPEDREDRVLEIWSELWGRDREPENRNHYANLALALALIYDQSGGVPKAQDPQHATPDLEYRYRWLRDQSEAGKLTESCKDRPVRELVRVVDFNISLEEAEWVHKHISGPPSQCGNEYDDIEYLMERAVNGLNPYDSYSLEQIKKHGGICADQAHYSVNAAKVRGIAAMVTGGTGDRGAHAWISYMPGPHEWAHHADQGITNGYIHCSQRDARMPERQLVMESERDFDPDRRVPALIGVGLAKVAMELGKYDVARSQLAAGEKAAGLNLELWQAEAALLEESGASAEVWQDFIQRLEREYRDYPDVREWSLDLKIEHLISRLPEEEVVSLIERELRRVARKVGTQGSALFSTIQRIGGMIAKSTDPDAGKNLRAFYKTCFRRYGEDLELCGKMMDAYEKTGRGLDDVRIELPHDVLRFYKRHVDTGSKEFFRAKMELSLLQKVADIYRDLAPDDLDAYDGIVKDIERRRARIERAAQ
ncbi:hypothetical protein [Haloferula sargassicola]|uniref:Transglutaminase-like domain-containing protein n=1 Tax=Haloferula sargassicola TaxID=490096 RepID=A0ABP9URT6_9BACT